MRNRALVLFVTCLLFSSLALAQGKSAEKKAAGKPAAAGVPDKALMQKVLAAWENINIDEVSKYYDQAPSDVFYDVAPVKYQGWSQYAAGVKELAATIKSIQFTLNDDAVVHHAGNLAWGTATVATAMTDKSDKTTNLSCRWTVVWEKKGANWLIVHDHFSAPMEAPK